VKGPAAEAKIYLNNFEIERSRGFTERDLKIIVALVEDYNDELLAKWEEYHGKEE
jgi:hypothetical protein